ncbi:OsmC family peroxiredoxin [Flavobacterium sp.]|uniref:OsmC family peroxiredoxin n=1 Tax=Flavobacterium sp. TaxID=239 RepID=UPI002FDE0BA9
MDSKDKLNGAIIVRKASAHWEGNLKDGVGFLSSESGILNQTNYSYKTRFDEGIKGTNPEELIAAAHAGCFTMAVCAKLNAKGITPKTLDTQARIRMNNEGIISAHLKIYATVPNISSEDFSAIVEDAEQNCFVSKILNIPITSDISFEFEEAHDL